MVTSKRDRTRMSELMINDRVDERSQVRGDGTLPIGGIACKTPRRVDGDAARHDQKHYLRLSASSAAILSASICVICGHVICVYLRHLRPCYPCLSASSAAVLAASIAGRAIPARRAARRTTEFDLSNRRSRTFRWRRWRQFLLGATPSRALILPPAAATDGDGTGRRFGHVRRRLASLLNRHRRSS